MSLSVELRKRIYSSFAKEANDAGVQWIVLHGIEGYPGSIGRDLDVKAIDPASATRLLEIFEGVLRREKLKWIVHTSPTWGRRLLGITETYGVVELHTIDRVRIVNVEFKPDWKAIEYVEGLFPVERFVTFCKACLLPAIMGDKSWRKKCDGAPEPKGIPWWSGRAAGQAIARTDIDRGSKAVLCGGFLVSHPFVSLASAFHWLRTKTRARVEPTVPVFALPEWMEPTEFEELIKDRLGELFLKVVCADQLSIGAIKSRQARQQMIYVTGDKADKIGALEVGPDPLSQEELLQFLVRSFCEFNEQWRS